MIFLKIMICVNIVLAVNKGRIKNKYLIANCSIISRIVRVIAIWATSIIKIIIITRFYIALSHPEGPQSASHYYPWSLGIKSLIKPSQLPSGEYTACATLICATRLKIM